MKYSKVFLESIGYELPPIVVTSAELEERLTSVYSALNISKGQLEALTGIKERRWWEPGFVLSEGAAKAAEKAMAKTNLRYEDIGILIYAGVCREDFEPATAYKVANKLGISGEAAILDISNACLGILNGMVEVANRIELGHIKAGMVVSCESARDINDTMISRMCANKSMEVFKRSVATLTGGSGAAAVILTDGSFLKERKRRIIGGVVLSEPKYHDLCRWRPDAGETPENAQIMTTDSVSVLRYGVRLGHRAWTNFLKHMNWDQDSVDRVICHQVGSSHQDAILDALHIPPEKDFTTFRYLGNMGTVSLPITAAVAEERGHILSGHKVGFLGIGSGLSCLMLGCRW